MPLPIYCEPCGLKKSGGSGATEERSVPFAQPLPQRVQVGFQGGVELLGFFGQGDGVGRGFEVFEGGLGELFDEALVGHGEGFGDGGVGEAVADGLGEVVGLAGEVVADADFGGEAGRGVVGVAGFPAAAGVGVEDAGEVLAPGDGVLHVGVGVGFGGRARREGFGGLAGEGEERFDGGLEVGQRGEELGVGLPGGRGVELEGGAGGVEEHEGFELGAVQVIPEGAELVEYGGGGGGGGGGVGVWPGGRLVAGGEREEDEAEKE